MSTMRTTIERRQPLLGLANKIVQRGDDMELHEILKEWLKDNGYDGLVDDELECVCDLNDLMPCGQPSVHCEAGYKVRAPKGSNVDFFIKAPER